MMSFSRSVRIVLFEKYVTFRGRASRSEFWWWQLFILLFWGSWDLFFSFIDLMFGLFQAPILQAPILQTPILQTPIMKIIEALLNLLVFIPQTAVSVRRFHDVGLSGWWYLIVALLQIYSGFIYILYGGAYPNFNFTFGWSIFIGILVLLIGIPLIIVFCQRGTYGVNRYGPDPLRFI